MNVRETIQQTNDILDRAYEEYKPQHIVALFSGGDDSLVNTHLTVEWGKARQLPVLVVHINTGIGIDETRAFVRQTTQEQSWTYKEYVTDPQVYIDLVTGKNEPDVPGGFPGAPLHFIYYSRLKDRRIDQLKRELKRHIRDRILLSTGLRQQESKKRMGYNKPYSKEKGKSSVWANPLFYASKDQLLDIRDTVKLPSSQVSACLHRSGECLCGAMNDVGELEELRFWYPRSAAYIDQINEQTIAAGYPWEWDAPNRIRNQLRAGQTFLEGFAPLCSSCDARAALREAA